MNRPAIGKALVLCAAMSLPALAAAPAGRLTSFEAGNARVMVKYKSEGSLMRESTLAARAGEPARAQHAARLSQRLGVHMTDGAAIAPRTQVLHAKGLSSAELVARLLADPEVEQAEIDARVKRADIPNDQLYGNQPVNITPAAGQWYLRPNTATFVSAINAQMAWDLTLGSPSVVVAVLDTGVRRDHPDLAGKLLPGYDFVTADSPNVFATANDGNGVDPDPSDPGDWVTQAEADQVGGPLEGCEVGESSWHGTQTAALVGAATNNGAGMASVGRNVRILPVRVLGKCGGFISDVIAGMRWAAGISSSPVPNPTPAKVMNLSLGSSGSCVGSLYEAAVADVVAAGVSVVVSAGNDVGRAVGRPANCAGAIGVGGLRHTGTKVGFSDVGQEIALSAPGGNCVNTFGTCLFPILTATNAGSTVPGANTFSDGENFSVGTSFSSPLVAGAVGLMLSANPTLNPAQLRTALRNSSRAFPTTGGSNGIAMCQAPTGAQQDECYCTTTTCGAGMLDVAAAVAAAGAPATSQAVAVATPAVPAPAEAVTLDASASVPSSGRTITAYDWTMVDSGGIATLGVTTNASTANVTTSGTGVFTVRLRATDSGNISDTVDLRVTVAVPVPVDTGSVSNPPSSGGGSLSWPWLLALGVAVAMLRPRRVL